MTTTKPNHCPKCWPLVQPADPDMGRYQEYGKCIDAACTCHKVNATKPQHEGWEQELDTLTHGKRATEHHDGIYLFPGEAIVGYEKLKSFIRTHIQAAQEDMRRKFEAEKKSKDEAYRERNMLVCALTKLFPAYLARHDEKDMGWERDWMWIVYIDLPTGQVSWHLHDSDVAMFRHLKVQENKWDGHNTQRKYEHVAALEAITPTKD